MTPHFRRHILISIVIIVGSAALASGGLYWFSGDIAAQVKDIVASRASISRRSQLLQALAALKAGAPEAERYQSQMDALLPDRDQLIDFPRWLESQARIRRLTISFSFQGEAANPGSSVAGSAPFLFTVSGDSEDITAFLGEIEVRSTRFLIEITEFDVQRIAGDYSVSVAGKVFFR